MKESARVLAWCVVLLCLGAAYTLVPLWAPLVLAAWVAALLSPALRRISAERHKRRSAALLTTALVVTVLIPVAIIGTTLAGAALDLAQRVVKSPNQTEALKTLFLEGPPASLSIDRLSLAQLAQLARDHGQSALVALSAVAGATTKVIVGSVVFVLATYVFLVDGARLYAWLVERAVMKRAHVERFAGAFIETGRGLLIGTGLTASIQGALATIGYFALGIPRALVLGFLTGAAALIPAIGTGLVWVPVCIALAIARRYGAALAMLAIGMVISVADNFIRPALSRAGALRLPTLAVFVAMIGGVSVFGGWGLVLGPLLVRMAIEGLDVIRDARDAAGALARRAGRPARTEHRPSQS